MLENKIILAFASDYVGSWKDLARFARQQLSAETALSPDHFEKMAEGGLPKLQRLKALLLRIEGTPKHRVISQYFHILEGSLFFEASGAPFPKPSIIQSVAPLTNACQLGEHLLPIRGAVEMGHHLDTAHRLHNDAAHISQLTSWSMVRAHMGRLRDTFPDLNPDNVLLYLRSDEPLEPAIDKAVRGALEDTFGVKLSSAKPALAADGSKPH